MERLNTIAKNGKLYLCHATVAELGAHGKFDFVLWVNRNNLTIQQLPSGIYLKPKE